MSKRIIMEGQTFSQGTKVLEFLYNKNDQSYYSCLCTNCGHKFIQDGYSTRIGRQGCKYCRKINHLGSLMENEPYNVGKIRRDWWGKRIVAVVNKRRKKNPDFEYSISMKQGWEQFEKQEGKCAYTKLPLSFPKQGALGGTASLDRIDSSRGYIEGNIQWVHTDINNMKSDMTQEQFINLCKLVITNINSTH